MDINEYLRHKTQRLEKSFGRVRDPRVFDFNFIPDQLPIMRDELRPVIDALIRYHMTGIPNHTLIVGSRGSGKTLSLRYLEGLFRERGLTMLYVNCRVHNSGYKILAHLLGARARGVSFSELAERFTDKFPSKTVVILDEADLLSDKHNNDILYFLSRSPANYMAVLLSNNPKWSTSLDESIQSTLQPEILFFRSYSATELAEILRQRARSGLKSIEEDVIGEIAARTAKYTNSDVRVALKTLYYSAVEPGSLLDGNFERARKDIVIEVVRNLSDKSLLILKAGGPSEKPVKEVYESYRRLCGQHKELPFSYVHFYSNLAYLQSLGLILLVNTKVHRTYTKLMQLTFPAEMLDTVWRYRFG